MQTLTCPIPDTITPLQSNGFMFGVAKMPELTYFCQEASIPDITLPSAMTDTPFIPVPIAGDKMSFGELSITFLVDDKMHNYQAIYGWITALGFPQLRDQFAKFVAEHGGTAMSTTNATNSDCVLQILNNTNNPIATVRFVDAFPTNLSGLTLRTTDGEATYLAGTATFQYSYYEFL